MSKTYKHLRQDQASIFHKRQKARDGVWRRGKTEFNNRSRQDTSEFVEGSHSAVPPTPGRVRSGHPAWMGVTGGAQ